MRESCREFWPYSSLAPAVSPGNYPVRAAPWTRIVTPDFELLTTGGEDAGRGLLVRLERLRAVLQPVFPQRTGKAVCIIEFGTRDEFLPYAPISRSIGYFLPGARRDFVVLDGTHAEGRSAGHEYVHFALSQSGLRLPAWLNEGLAELYSNVDESRTVGQFIPGRVISLRRGDWIALAELTAATRGVRDAFTNAGSVDAAYAESWLLSSHAGARSPIPRQIPGLAGGAASVHDGRGIRAGLRTVARRSGAGSSCLSRLGREERARLWEKQKGPRGPR